MATAPPASPAGTATRGTVLLSAGTASHSLSPLGASKRPPFNHRLSSPGRRQSIYGSEDRVVLDIGSRYIKVGFSDGPRPRHILEVALPRGVRHGGQGEGCGEGCTQKTVAAELVGLDLAKGDEPLLQATLERLIRDIYFNYLLADPKDRRVIVCEPPLMQLPLKRVICNILFRQLQVPSVSFINYHLLALLTTGSAEGIVVDCGNLETSVLPIFDSRPLIPFISTTPRAGMALVRRLSCILRAEFGRRLSRETLEDVQARLLFIAPKVPVIGPSSTPLTFASDEEETTFARQLKEVWAPNTSARQSIYKIRTEWEGTDDQVTIPGWVRERTAEVLFENDEDARGIAECLLETFLKMPRDLRAALAPKILLAGGIAHIPNFRIRLSRQITVAVETRKRYRCLAGLVSKFAFYDDPPQTSAEGTGSKPAGLRGAAFLPNIRAWVGGSLLGSMLSTTWTAGPEILRDDYLSSPDFCVLPDWTHFTDDSVSAEGASHPWYYPCKLFTEVEA